MIIHLNGMPGVGKLSVARELSPRIAARLIDNHLLLDLVISAVGRGTPGYIPLVNAISETVYRALAEHGRGENVIFTNALANELPEDHARFEAIRQLARRMETPFVPVLLRCDEAANIQRLTSADRQHKRKLTDAGILRQLIANHDLVHPQDHPNALELNTTDLSPNAAASAIERHVECCRHVEPL